MMVRVAATGEPPRSRRKRAEGTRAMAILGFWEKEEDDGNLGLGLAGEECLGLGLGLGLELPLGEEKVGKEGMEEEMKGRCGIGRASGSSNIISPSPSPSPTSSSGI